MAFITINRKTGDWKRYKEQRSCSEMHVCSSQVAQEEFDTCHGTSPYWGRLAVQQHLFNSCAKQEQKLQHSFRAQLSSPPPPLPACYKAPGHKHTLLAARDPSSSKVDQLMTSLWFHTVLVNSSGTLLWLLPILKFRACQKSTCRCRGLF